MKTKHFLGMMAGVWMLAACSNQDELLKQDGETTKQCVTVNAYVPDGIGSRLAFEDQGANGLKVSWNESGESFSVMTADVADPVTFTQTEGSEFAGPDGFTFAEGTDYYAYYPALQEGMLGADPETGELFTEVSAKAIPFNVFEQTGQLDENKNLMYAKRSAEGDFQFKHMLAVMKFTLKGIQGKPVQNVEISFAHEPDLYYTFGTVDVTGENPVFTAEGPSDMLIPAENLTADEDGNYVVYAYLPPLAADTEVKITAYSENKENNQFITWRDEFTVNNEGIKAGYYYTAARGMEAKEEENVKLNFTAGTVEELKAWIDALNIYSGVNLTLTADIDLTGADLDGNENNDSNWPNELWLMGTVDGDGHSIEGIKLDDSYQAAPFRIESTGVVKNLHLKNVAISGMYAGGIAIDNDGTISGCSVSGSVEALEEDCYAGGIVGINRGTVIGCSNSGTITSRNGSYDCAGGIVGYMSAGSIKACYNTGTITGNDKGGIVGEINYTDVTIDACYHTSETPVVGNINESTVAISNCYWASSSVTAAVETGSATVTGGGRTADWSDAMSAMNTALNGSGWKYVENTDDATKEKEPLKLEKVNP